MISSVSTLKAHLIRRFPMNIGAVTFISMRGFFYYSCPKIFEDRFTEYAVNIRNNPPPELEVQNLNPWLDQVALPLVIHSLGGGRDTLPDGYLDGKVSCHYRALPLLYARENDDIVTCIETVAAPNKIKKALKENNAFRRYIFQGRGKKVRDLFDQNNFPRKEQAIRNKIKSKKLWMR